jgi:hypothetical protein
MVLPKKKKKDRNDLLTARQRCVLSQWAVSRIILQNSEHKWTRACSIIQNVLWGMLQIFY